MFTSIKEILLQKDGTARVQFPTNDKELVDFIESNYPKEARFSKIDLHDGPSPTIASGIQHQAWSFTNDEDVEKFTKKLQKDWDFNIEHE